MKKLLALDENWRGTPSLRAPPISIEISLFQCTAGASVKPVSSIAAAVPIAALHS